jgi:hypothetical protein
LVLGTIAVFDGLKLRFSGERFHPTWLNLSITAALNQVAASEALAGGASLQRLLLLPIFNLPHVRYSPVVVSATVEKLFQRCHLLGLLMQPLREVKQREHHHTGASDLGDPC